MKRRNQQITSALLLLLFVGYLLAARPLAGQEKPASSKELPQTEEGVPPLSVETLFSPQQSFKYFGPPPPATHWLSDSRLAIRRDQQWEVLDPVTGATTEWTWPEELRSELGKLSGLPADAVEEAVKQVVTAAENLDRPMMVRVGRGLAILGGGSPPRLISRDARGWENPELSPNGAAIAYVQNHDLYMLRIDSGEVLRLTHDGSASLLNGVLDWTYQEEIYGRGNFKGFWWSPDSRHLAFLKIDVSQVLPFTLTRSNSPRGATLVSPYPKAGDPIPQASLWSLDTESLQGTLIHRPEGLETDSLVVRVTWRPDGRRLTYQVQNRIQSWLELRERDLATSHSLTLLREAGPAWVEILGEPHWLPDGDFLWLSDLPHGRRHLWHISADGSRRVPMTRGDWDVREVLRVIPVKRLVFVCGDRLQGGRGQQIYAVHWNHPTSHLDQNVIPLTETPGWHVAAIAPNGQHLVDTHSTLVDEPIKWLVEIAPDQITAPVSDLASDEAPNEAQPRVPANSPRKRLGPKEEPLSPWKSLSLSNPRWLDFQTADGVPLPAYELVPAKQSSPDGRFPVLIFTYGGPQAASAVDRWNGRNFLFHQFLVSSGIGVVVVDNRSSSGRGIADTWSIYRRMGVQEVKDLLEFTTYLSGLPWVDSDRLAIRGWSFGGFYTAYAMTQSTAFRAGIAGGSVTDWRNYDAFYTERYMDTPQANEGGYRETSVIEKAANLHGRILLIHGEVDDNVHPSNTLQLVSALQRAGKSFDLMIYPEAAHGVTQQDQVYHLHQTMFDFLHRELHPSPVENGQVKKN